jgi:hypothetical protein
MNRLLIIVATSAVLSGCAYLRIPSEGAPCEPQACTLAQRWHHDRDPFPVGPITYGTIFGPQPSPGKVTVD